MQKTYEKDFGDQICKIYTLDDTETVPQIIEALRNSHLRAITVYIYEDVDGEMKSIEGYYYSEKIIKYYDYVMSKALFPEDVSIRLTGDYWLEKIELRIRPYAKTISMFVSNKEHSVEFSDFFDPRPPKEVADTILRLKNLRKQ